MEVSKIRETPPSPTKQQMTLKLLLLADLLRAGVIDEEIYGLASDRIRKGFVSDKISKEAA